MSVTLINCFTVPEGSEETFLAGWRDVAERFATADGFVSTRLHRNTGLADKSFDFVNVAVWESVETYRAAATVALRDANRIPGVVAYPGLFEVVFES